MTRPGIEPRSPGPLANTLLIMPMAQLIVQILLVLGRKPCRWGLEYTACIL